MPASIAGVTRNVAVPEPTTSRPYFILRPKCRLTWALSLYIHAGQHGYVPETTLFKRVLPNFLILLMVNTFNSAQVAYLSCRCQWKIKLFA